LREKQQTVSIVKFKAYLVVKTAGVFSDLLSARQTTCI